jgi:hypothetical protein
MAQYDQKNALRYESDGKEYKAVAPDGINVQRHNDV